MGNIKIRVAQINDQGRLGALLKTCLLAPLSDQSERARSAGWPAASAEDELMAADDWYFTNIDVMNCCYFAWDGDTAVGVVAVNAFTTELQYIAVLPDYRRQGIGRLLMKEAFTELQERGVDHIRVALPSDPRLPDAEPFFKALGFLTVRTVTELGCRLPIANESS